MKQGGSFSDCGKIVSAQADVAFLDPLGQK